MRDVLTKKGKQAIAGGWQGEEENAQVELRKGFQAEVDADVEACCSGSAVVGAPRGRGDAEILQSESWRHGKIESVFCEHPRGTGENHPIRWRRMVGNEREESVPDFVEESNRMIPGGVPPNEF